MTRFRFKIVLPLLACLAFNGCKNKEPAPVVAIPNADSLFSFMSLKVNSVFRGFHYTNVNKSPVIELLFSEDLDPDSFDSSLSLTDNAGSSAQFSTFIENGRILVVQPAALKPITHYHLNITTGSAVSQRRKTAIGSRHRPYHGH